MLNIPPQTSTFNSYKLVLIKLEKSGSCSLFLSFNVR